MTRVCTIRHDREAASEVLECRRCGVVVTQTTNNGSGRGQPPEHLHLARGSRSRMLFASLESQDASRPMTFA
jgi:hypothetical protein